MKIVYDSGASKRRKAKEIEVAKNKLPKIDNFFQHVVQQQSITDVNEASANSIEVISLSDNKSGDNNNNSTLTLNQSDVSTTVQVENDQSC